MQPMNRLGAGLLGSTSAALAVLGGYYMLEFLRAGDDSWDRLAIVPAIVALVTAAFVAIAAYLVWRDTRSGWLGAAVLTVVLGIAWIDLGMGSPGLEVPFLVIPLLVIGGMLGLTAARLTRRGPSTEQ